MPERNLKAAVEAAQKAQERAENAAKRAEGVAKERRPAIWLEIAEVRLETEKTETNPNPNQDPLKRTCSVQLKADREHPKPVWWQVDDTAAGKDALETYKAILNEMDKKRVVLARLSVDPKESPLLHCDALRFQSPELGNR